MLTSETREAALSRLGRALADPTRCRILVALLDGVNYPGQLATKLELTRSNVSNHLACLRGCGLVVAAYEGRQVRYELADPHLARALSEFVQVVLAVDTGEPCDDEVLSGEAAPGAGTPCADEVAGRPDAAAAGAAVNDEVVADG
ncbi:DNA-binding transcriptional regulator, ArsR family [Prauserella aidingensis]|nr:metalloregulator ArsR/SmtB family transcription factor [Prauserella aidingensis]MCP2255915.1 DNA-binding transcriptional regulator, ArsR family [Prauserella aidingensis]